MRQLVEEVAVLQAIVRHRDRQLAVEVDNPYPVASLAAGEFERLVPDTGVRAALIAHVGRWVWEGAVMELRRAQREVE